MSKGHSIAEPQDAAAAEDMSGPLTKLAMTSSLHTKDADPQQGDGRRLDRR